MTCVLQVTCAMSKIPISDLLKDSFLSDSNPGSQIP